MSKDIPQFERYEPSDAEEESQLPLFGTVEKGINLNSGSVGANEFTQSINHGVRIVDNKIDPDDKCGIRCYHPEWLQKFASKKTFMVIFSLLSIVQGMSWAYFTATITTLEKRFKISSETAGIVMTGNEISQILFSIILSYYAGRGNRPKWIATGVIFSALSAFILASPHLIYGPGNDALSLTEEYGNIYDMPTTPTPLLSNTSLQTNITSGISLASAANRNKVQTCRKSLAGETSNANDCDKSDVSIVPLVLIFISQFVMGIGVLLFYSLGGPYLDDNVSNTKTPMVFGITMSVRLVGPTLGFLFAGACLKLFISPWLTPIIGNSDPRWTGAWWLGWIALGSLMAFTSVFIAMFPKVLPRTKVRNKLTANNMTLSGMGHTGALKDTNKMGSQMILTPEVLEETGAPKLSELAPAILSLLKNKTNVFNTLAGIFYMFSAIGYWTYMPKYMETIFRLNAVNASVISGTVSLVFQAAGTLISGALITKFLPRARVLAGWNVVLGLAYVCVLISFTQFGCDQGNLMLGQQNEGEQTWSLSDTCNADCNCKVNKMLPVCYQAEKQVFYSACHAGCSSFVDGVISNCSCLPSLQEEVTLGTCADSKCLTTFITFLLISAIIKLLDSTGRIGNMLVAYRCVDPKEKSLAIGIAIFLTSIFAFLPAPILFGKIFDSVCLVWGSKCGVRGNCWLYDGKRLRYMLNLTAAAFTLLGAIFDAFVWYYVKDLDLYDEQKNIIARKKEKTNRT